MRTRETHNKKIIIAAGGTLGHINPALVMARLLAKSFDVYFITTPKEKKVFADKDYLKKIFYIDSPVFNRKKIWKNFFLLFKIQKAKKEISKVLAITPSLIIGFGGSISTITILRAFRNHLPCIAHEQNAILGLGNKLIKNKVNKLLLSYPITNINAKVVGNPVESEMFEKKRLISNRDNKHIVIVGGSNGSEKMNDFFIENRDMFKDYKVTLLTGKRYYKENKEKINNANNQYFQIYDRKELYDLYLDSYIVISRAGATTISEIIALEIISLTIPSPNVSKNHQFHNAKYYYNKGCIELLEEKDLNKESLKNKLVILTNENNRKEMKQNMHTHHNIYSKYLFYEEIIGVID